jgi:hypothetical protein
MSETVMGCAENNGSPFSEAPAETLDAGTAME